MIDNYPILAICRVGIGHNFRECSFEKCWGGPENGGGACKFRIGFGGGQVNSALDLGGGHVNSAYVEKSL